MSEVTQRRQGPELHVQYDRSLTVTTKLHFDSFGNFLRRNAFALSSTFLYAMFSYSLLAFLLDLIMLRPFLILLLSHCIFFAVPFYSLFLRCKELAGI